MRFRLNYLTVGCLMVAGLTANVQADDTAKIQTYETRQRQTRQQRRSAEQQLREVKQQQRSALTAVSQSEKRLSGAQAELRVTRVKLAATEQRIRDNRANLERINTELEAHIDELWQRLEVFYKQGNLGYVEVLLGSADFEQFVDRTTILRSVAESDLELKQVIEEARAEKELLQAQLDDDWRQIASLREQAEAKAEQIEQETLRKKAALDEIRRDRAKLEAVRAEFLAAEREIQRVLYTLQSSGGGHNGTWGGRFVLPCRGRYTSSFGWRRHPIHGGRSFHDGQDIAAPSGTTIRAAADGTVVHSGWKGPYGRCVMVAHGSGYVTLYGHCSATLVNVGQRVRQGQPIGRVGSTGWSTGPHLHWSVYRNGKAVNPLSFR